MISSQAKASVGLLTASEIAAGGYEGADSAPGPETCKYCGATLQYKGLIGAGRVMQWMQLPERCTCKKAIDHWAAYDAKRAAEQEAEQKAAEQKARCERAIQLVGDNRIKRRFAQRTFDTWVETPKNRQAYIAAFDYAFSFSEYAKNGTGLYLEGPCGTGKTHLVAAITNQLMGIGVPVVCKTSIGILDDIKSAFKADEQKILRLYKTIDLLIIDDLGKELCTEWSQSVLYSILNERYEDLRPTCITTNYGEDDLVEQLTVPDGDNSRAKAIISRLHETNIVVSMVWEDYRGRPV